MIETRYTNIKCPVRHFLTNTFPGEYPLKEYFFAKFRIIRFHIPLAEYAGSSIRWESHSREIRCPEGFPPRVTAIYK